MLRDDDDDKKKKKKKKESTQKDVSSIIKYLIMSTPSINDGAIEPSHTVLLPQDYSQKFDPDAYLQFYFSQDAIEDGTRVSLFALPVFAQLMLQTMRPSERETLLDIGAGPTVYSALCFRDVSKRVHLADYVERNLDVLRKWVRNEETIDWVPTIKVIKRTEGGPVPTEKVCEEVEEKARGLVKSGGIHFADVHQEVVVPELDGKQVDILVSIFTLESACRNYEEYCRCAQNMMRNLRSGGRFVLGSVLEDDEYNSGRQTIFHLLNLREQMILDALSACGLDVANAKKYVLDGEGVMFLMATKL